MTENLFSCRGNITRGKIDFFTDHLLDYFPLQRSSPGETYLHTMLVYNLDMAVRFDGRLFARQKLNRVGEQIATWSLRSGRRPRLVSLFPFEDHASVTYTKLKQKDAVSVGVDYDAKPLSLRAPRRG